MPTVINKILALLAEIGGLVAYACWGASGFEKPVQSTFAALAVASLVALLWSIFAAPKSPYRLRSHGLLGFKGLVFAGAVAALFIVGSLSAGMLSASISATHLALASWLRIL